MTHAPFSRPPSRTSSLLAPSSASALADCHAPALETRRLLLQAPRPEDAAAIARLANNRRIAEMTASLPFPYSTDDARTFIHEGCFSADSAIFALWQKRPEGPAIIGMCGYTPRSGEAVPEIGYWLGEPFWGQGLATEAVEAVITHAFSSTPVTVLSGSARVVNARARRVLEKCGFGWQNVGLWRVEALGASLPVDRFRLDREMWNNRTAPTPPHPRLRCAH